MTVEACTQAICDLALRFGEDRKGGAKEDIMVSSAVLCCYVSNHLRDLSALFSF